jgi:hypothetical protein
MKTFAILFALVATATATFACTQVTPNEDLDLRDDRVKSGDDDDDEERDRDRRTAPPSQSSSPAPTPSGTDAGTNTDAGGFTSTKTPEQTCLDTANVIALAAERCGEDYFDEYDAFIDAAAGGSCANVTKIRDEAALRGECFTYFATVSCSQIYDAPPSSCNNQLQ